MVRGGEERLVGSVSWEGKRSERELELALIAIYTREFRLEFESQNRDEMCYIGHGYSTSTVRSSCTSALASVKLRASSSVSVGKRQTILTTTDLRVSEDNQLQSRAHTI
jgi:hypothetical protein